MKPARTETFEHAISGLLKRRAEMVEEIAGARELFATLSNDLAALDRTLENLGYLGDVELTPRTARILLFYRNELRDFIVGQLEKEGPQTSRQIAVALMATEGKNAADRRVLGDVVRRVSRATRHLRQTGRVTSDKVDGEYVWRLVQIVSE